VPSEFGHYVSKKTFADSTNKLTPKIDKIEDKVEAEEIQQGAWFFFIIFERNF